MPVCCKTIKFYVILRNGTALRGYPKRGTALANCDIEVEDHVVDGHFAWFAKPAKEKKGANRGKSKK